jgi:hypothetical protein
MRYLAKSQLLGEKIRSLFQKNPEQVLMYIAILQMIGRSLFVFFFAPPPHGVEDLDIAQHLARGEGFSIYDRGPTTAKGPIYPFFLSVFLWMGFAAKDLWPAALIQHLLLSWVPYLMYRLGEKLRIEKIAWIAAFLFAFHPSFWYYPTVLENTSLFIFLTLGWAIGVCRLREAASGLLSVAVGLWWGAMWIEKPVAFVPMTVAVIALLPRKLWLRLSVWAFLPIAVWALRGYGVFGYFTWTKTFASQHSFAYSWHPNFAVSPAYAVSETVAQRMDSLFRLPEHIGGPALQAMGYQIFQQKGLFCVIERTLLHAGIFWWIPPKYWQDKSLRFWLVRRFPVLVINALFLVGLVGSLRRYPGVGAFILGSSLWFTAFYAVNHVLNIRYRLDIEWLQLYICAMAILYGRGLYARNPMGKREDQDKGDKKVVEG